ncbi:MAG: hypothetical protein AAF991_00570 [Pseudomonadota bacterium]
MIKHSKRAPGRHYFLLIALVPVFLLTACAGTVEKVIGNEPIVTLADLQPLAGENWKGSLTYLNFQEPFKYFTIPAELEVSVIDTEERKGIELSYRYPEEPQANSKSTILLSANGRMLGAETVVERADEDGELRIVTRFDCIDNEVDASCSVTYRMSPSTFTFTKTVTVGEEDAFRRNEFSFTR